MSSFLESGIATTAWLRNQGVRDKPGGMKVEIIAQMLVEEHKRTTPDDTCNNTHEPGNHLC